MGFVGCVGSEPGIRMAPNPSSSSSAGSTVLQHIQSHRDVPVEQLFTKLDIVGKGAYGAVYKGYVPSTHRHTTKDAHIYDSKTASTMPLGPSSHLRSSTWIPQKTISLRSSARWRFCRYSGTQIDTTVSDTMDVTFIKPNSG